MIASTSADPIYTQALSKGGALLPETRLLLSVWKPGVSEQELAEQVLNGDLLGRASARRVLDIVRVFTLRYLTPTDAAARHLKRLSEGAVSKQVLSDLALHYSARRDALLRDFTADIFWPAVREGRLVVTNADVRQLILAGEQDGRIAAPWSEEIKRDMAGRVLIALTDFGLVQEFKPSKRQVALYRPADGTVVYLAYLLHEQGVSDASLAGQPEWKLFGLEPGDVWHRMEAMAGEGWFVIQRAGDVARITWACGSLEEAVDVLAR